MTPTRRTTRSAGFTLIELLLGAVITAVLLAALHAVFQSLLQAQAHANERVEASAPRALAVAVIRKDIENMVVPNGVLSGNVLGQTEESGENRADTLEFGTTSGRVGQAKPWGEIQKVAYSLQSEESQEDDSGVQLVRSVTRNLLAADTEDQQEDTVLLEHVASLAFEYYDGQVWTDAWDSTTVGNATPRLVRVTIAFAEQDGAKAATPKPLEIVCEVTAQKAPEN